MPQHKRKGSLAEQFGKGWFSTRVMSVCLAAGAVGLACQPAAADPTPAGPPPAKAGIEWVSSKPVGTQFAKTETTIAQFRACVEAGACRPGTFTTQADFGLCNLGLPDRDLHPMNCVTWHGAAAFCEWAGGRLPSEDEWYAEASDGGSRQYPWGNQEVTCDLAVWGDGSNWDGCGRSGTWPVCSKKSGNSVSGLCDLSGNLWEWTSSEVGSHRVERGGAWNDDSPADLSAAGRYWFGPTEWSPSRGFRCVRPPSRP